MRDFASSAHGREMSESPITFLKRMMSETDYDRVDYRRNWNS